MRVGAGVEFVDVANIEQWVGNGAWVFTKAIALVGEFRDGDRNRDGILQFFQLAVEQRPAGPRTIVGNIQVIAARLRPKAAVSGWAGRAVRGDPMPKRRFLPDKTAPGRPCVFFICQSSSHFPSTSMESLLTIGLATHERGCSLSTTSTGSPTARVPAVR